MRGALLPALIGAALWGWSCGETSPSFREINTTHWRSDAGNDTSSHNPSIPDDEDTVSFSFSDASFIPLIAEDETCLSEVREAERLDVDLFVTLDRSGSMLSSAGMLSKWEAVKQALSEFLLNPQSAGIGVGLRVFPQIHEDVPFECFNNTECGAAAPCSIPGVCPDGTFCTSDFPCFHWNNPSVNGYCENAPSSACTPGTQCPGGRGPCLELECTNGYCADNSLYGCQLGTHCIDAENNDLGECLPQAGFCSQGDSCDIADYATPDVPITLGADRNGAIATLLGDTEPAGFTPTTPALQGAIEYTRTWGRDHPGRVAAVVLATDGFPSECTPLTDDPIEPVLEAARAGVALSPPIRTYVVGVFAPEEGSEASQILNSIAVAGDTQSAFFVSAGNDTTQEFLAALQSISSTAISCEFALPEEEGLDYGAVNLRLTEGDGDLVQLVNVGSPAGCSSSERGWYYLESADGGLPSQIQVCPNVCRQFSRSGGGRVDLQIGCRTIIR